MKNLSFYVSIALVFAVLMLGLVGCGQMDLDTPEKRYLAVNSAATAILKGAEQYVDACNTKPKDNPCYDKFPKINKGAKTLKASLVETDKVFITKNSPYYDLSLSAAENAMKELHNLIKE